MLVEELRQTCRQILESGQARVVIGYGQSAPHLSAYPVFITKPEDVEKLVWNNQCFPNLVAYLKRKEIQALGKPAVIVKGCDEKSLVVLERESQIQRDQMVVVGIACDGVGAPLEPKCRTCEVHVPRFSDTVVGSSSAAPSGDRYARLEEFRKKTPEERWQFWVAEMDRCVKCYACRQVCPLCYCERCIVDKNRPTCIDTSPTVKGNFAWHITRAFHLAGRCIGCGECSRGCPAGIDLALLNQALAESAERQFEYRAGMDPAVDTLIGSYSNQDKENFIG
jgi:coenzyme F420-reducing hydrogenase beta subunit